MLITVKDVNGMGYADFVAFIGQHNTPPGGEETIKKWGKLGKIDRNSYILDLACSTGFSSRSIVKTCNCKSIGIDISRTAIETAKFYADLDEITNKAHYVVGDASNLQFSKETFTHIFAGCNFGFIQEREKALAECNRVLTKYGILCIANFYYITTPPEDLLELVANAIGFKPNYQWTYDWWSSFFNKQFILRQEEDNELQFADEKQISEAIHTFIYTNSKSLNGFSDEIKSAAYNRLLKIRLILNEHRKYQRFNITLWNRK